MIKGLIAGLILGVVGVVAGAYYYFASGIAPVAVAGPMIPFERKMAHMALDAHIEKQGVGNPPLPADEPNLMAGADIYQKNCAVCHGRRRQIMPDTQVEQSALISPSGERLRDYDRLKLELGQALQTVLHLTGGQEKHDQHRRCQELPTVLAEDRLVLAVVGQFNRGKSSLMNAILGLERLPVGIVPLTSVITKVAYGNPERVLIEFQGGRLRNAIRMDQLGDYVTEEGNPGNQKRIGAAEIQLPSEFLRRGLSSSIHPELGRPLRLTLQPRNASFPRLTL